MVYGADLLVYGDQTFPGLTVNYGDTVIYGGFRITFFYIFVISNVALSLGIMLLYNNVKTNDFNGFDHR
ncbi:hypothetical protein HanPI659440_Chr07g0271281 [Helianthus annuus]|nr:hypothetical protein HanPI659440_Chr07g0271281 [Helianthus annuus]